MVRQYRDINKNNTNQLRGEPQLQDTENQNQKVDNINIKACEHRQDLRGLLQYPKSRCFSQINDEPSLRRL
jgi:hypothetical protein